MTPKEKAEELLNKMYNVRSNFDDKLAKECAVIVVDEILNYDLRAKSEAQFVIERRIEEYWGEVKKELESF